MKPRLAILSLALAASGGCSYAIHQLNASSVDRQSGAGASTEVKAEATDFVILRFEFDSDYVETGYKKLASACKGRLTQVTTEHVTSYKFLSYEQKIVLRGLCRT